MTFPQLQKAVLIPFERDDEQPNTDEEIELDFNPSTLRMEVTNSLEQGRGSNARQTVKETVSSLSFDVVFDSTHTSIEVANTEELDVRRRTQKLVQLLGPPAGSQNNEGGGNRVPSRVRFSWGTIIFDGVFSSYSESLDYFSPDGVPLRARVSIQLSEQEFQYQRDRDADLSGLARPSGERSGPDASPEDPRAQQFDDWSVADAASAVPAPGGPGSGLGSGLGGPFGFGASVDASFGLGASVSTGIELEGSFDFGIDVAAEIGADIDLGLAASVFGEGLFDQNSGQDLHPAVEVSSGGGSSTHAPGSPSTVRLPWSATAPAPGTLAGRVAADVARQRAASPAQPSAGGGSAPLVGAPPTRLPAVGPPARAVFTPQVPGGRVRGGLSPTWEVAPPPSADLAESCCATCGAPTGPSRRRPPKRPSPRRCRCAD